MAIDGIQAAASIAKEALTSGAQGKPGASSVSFLDLVKQPAVEALQSSAKADQTIVQSVTTQNVSDLDFTAAMSEAELSLQKFKAVYSTSVESLKKILDMPA